MSNTPRRSYIKAIGEGRQRLWGLVALIQLVLLTVPLAAQAQSYWLGKKSEWVAANLENVLTLQQIATSDKTLVPWKEGIKDILAFGMKANRFWVRAPIRNESNSPADVYIELQGAYFEYIDMYILNRDGHVDATVKGGSRRGHVNYMLNSPTPVIMATLAPDETKTLLLHVKHYGTINLPIFVHESKDVFTTSVLKNITKDSIFFASQFIIISLNLIFFITTKNFIFILFALSQVFHRCLSLASLDGFFQKFVANDWPWLTSRGFIIFVTVGLILTIEFSKQILKTALTKVQKGVLNFFIIINIFNLLLAIVYPSRFSILINIAAEVLFMSFATYYSYQAYKKSLNAAKYLVVAFPIMNLFTFLYALRFSGLFPINAFSNNSVQIASTIEIIMVGATLADRFNNISIDYIKQRAQATEIIQKNQLKSTVLKNLTKQVKLAAQLSDKLNSPLLVLFNIHETLSKRYKISSEKFYNSWPHLDDNMKNSLLELKKVSNQLEHMRESENKLLEATKLIKENEIENIETKDANL